ncbi:MAG: ArgE/DapE family deacylase [Gemmatimonadota bacterium]
MTDGTGGREIERGAREVGPGSGRSEAVSTLSPLERRVVDTLDVPAMLELLGRLVAIESLAGRERPAQELVARRMEELAMEPDVWAIDFAELRRHPAYAADVERQEGLGVVGGLGGEGDDGERRGNDGRTLILNGHVDVVPAGEPDRWSRPPFELTVEGDRVYGRGTADMKGGLCAALAAGQAIRDAGVELEGVLQIQSVIGEEDGGMGTLATLLRGHTGDGAVVLEPTDLVLAPAQAGAFNFRITIPGRAAHGALRSEGVDPIEKLLPLYARILELEAERNHGVDEPMFSDYDLPFAICVGKVRAGVWASTVAESLTLEGRYGVSPDEDPDVARAQLERAVREVADADPWLRDHPPELQWWGARFEPAHTPADDPVVGAVDGAFGAVTGRRPEIRGMTYGADMRLLVREAGIPTVLFGPGDVRDAHRPDESVAVADLETVARTMAVTALRFCGVAGE